MFTEAAFDGYLDQLLIRQVSVDRIVLKPQRWTRDFWHRKASCLHANADKGRITRQQRNNQEFLTSSRRMIDTCNSLSYSFGLQPAKVFKSAPFSGPCICFQLLTTQSTKHFCCPTKQPNVWHPHIFKARSSPTTITTHLDQLTHRGPYFDCLKYQL